MVTTTGETIAKQVNEARMLFSIRSGKYPKLQFVAWDDNSLKVSRGSQGVIIRYDAASDLYGLTYYVETDKSEEIDGICWDQFEELVVEKLTKKIRL